MMKKVQDIVSGFGFRVAGFGLRVSSFELLKTIYRSLNTEYRLLKTLHCSPNTEYRKLNTSNFIRISILGIMLLATVATGYGQTEKELKSAYKGEITSTYSIVLLPNFETTGDFDAYIVDEEEDPPYVPPVFSSTDGSDMNYIYTQTLRIPVNADSLTLDTFKRSSIAEAIQYFDGLGRPIQTIQIKGSPTGSDVIAPIDYDDFGREKFKYMTYVDSSTGMYRNDALDEQAIFYSVDFAGRKADSRPFSETDFENSPLNRILYERGAGEGWTENEVVRYAYETNTTGEVIHWKVENDKCIYDGHYDANELYKNTITDENGNKTIEYKDKEGLVILKQGELNTKTYYVYNDFNLLRFVLPPKAVSSVGSSNPDQETMDNLCYAYKYDERKRMIEKKIPGAGKVIMEYDALDRLIYTQDSVQRAKGEKLFTSYDKFSRPIATGIVKNGSADTLTRTYYDNYDFEGGYSYIETEGITNTALGKAKGQVTGTKTKLLGTDKHLISVNFYDNYYRVVQNQQQNQFGEFDITTNQYAFWGGVEKSVYVHNLNSNSNLTITRTYKYDHTGRLLSMNEEVNDQGEVTVAKMEYNELGELVSKKLQPISNKAAQTVDYDYNIRGWMTGINTPEQKQEYDLFSMQLYYNTDMPDGLDNQKQYNGNISGMFWSMGADTSLYPLQAYTFAYDKLNRLTKASYLADDYKNSFPEEVQNRFNEEITGYDLNGNIKGLVRHGGYKIGDEIAYGPVDSLVYDYVDKNNSNQLASVADNINIEAHGYMDKNSDGDDFTYDGNGNMVKDKDKGIDTIFYNYLNLPSKIVFDNNDSITYLYDAGGAKHMKRYYSNIAKDNSEFYVGSAIYQTDTSVGNPTISELKYMMTDEGRLSLQSDGEFAHEYMIKDHLGNTRVLFGDYNGNDSIEGSEILQQAHYYPFGLVFTGFDLDTDTNKFLYNGKELQTDGGLGWYDYGARFYDPALARFHSLDPLAEIYYSNSSFHYALNNPIKYKDFMGMGAEEKGKDDEKRKRAKQESFNKVSETSSQNVSRSKGSITVETPYKGFTYTSKINGSNSNINNVSDKSAKIIANSQAEANESEVTVTSTTRTVEDQARIMFDNAEKDGAESQIDLYAEPGEEVAKVYQKIRENALEPCSAEDTKWAMEMKIIEVGPTNVSKHIGDNNIVNVIDIGSNSVSNRAAFHKSIKANSGIQKSFTPYDKKAERAFHIEIKQ